MTESLFLSDACKKFLEIVEMYRGFPELQRTNYNEIDWTNVEFYDENILGDIEKILLGKVDGTSHRKSEMSYKERAFLNGIIRKAKPQTIVEIGVSAGGSSCIILNAIRDRDAKLYSFDYNTTWYPEVSLQNGRKTGFFVEETVPNLIDKWELYTGGVPSKYFDKLPKDGIDICFIDTMHTNPGEHLNILEILPYIKKGGIVIYHDTMLHIPLEAHPYNQFATTNCVSLNTLKGKRIYLKSENTMGLPNIGALILDEITDDILWSLFVNISLPWTYKISDKDFVEMFKHFSKYFPSDLVKIYIYYCLFYINLFDNTEEIAKRIAEQEVMTWKSVHK
ncbi:MAG: class I SAM-dependent methyltransferase [Firmicutes bacterium]|nr:class I SAM-dependent methyltransferase [Bacillota bacterium]